MCIRDRAQERPQNGSPELAKGAFCALFRGGSESADQIGDRGGPKLRNRKLAISNPQSANPQSAQSFA
eukprot:15154877-Alexandrium_andersonii.AAC.1